MGGIIGGVLAIPLTAALRTLMVRYVWKKRAQRTIQAAAAGDK
jgi:predicted PurR-regulated permease PerM